MDQLPLELTYALALEAPFEALHAWLRTSRPLRTLLKGWAARLWRERVDLKAMRAYHEAHIGDAETHAEDMQRRVWRAPDDAFDAGHSDYARRAAAVESADMLEAVASLVRPVWPSAPGRTAAAWVQAVSEQVNARLTLDSATYRQSETFYLRMCRLIQASPVARGRDEAALRRMLFLVSLLPPVDDAIRYPILAQDAMRARLFEGADPRALLVILGPPATTPVTVAQLQTLEGFPPIRPPLLAWRATVLARRPTGSSDEATEPDESAAMMMPIPWTRTPEMILQIMSTPEEMALARMTLGTVRELASNEATELARFGTQYTLREGPGQRALLAFAPPSALLAVLAEQPGRVLELWTTSASVDDYIQTVLRSMARVGSQHQPPWALPRDAAGFSWDKDLVMHSWMSNYPTAIWSVLRHLARFEPDVNVATYWPLRVLDEQSQTPIRWALLFRLWSAERVPFLNVVTWRWLLEHAFWDRDVAHFIEARAMIAGVESAADRQRMVVMLEDHTDYKTRRVWPPREEAL